MNTNQDHYINWNEVPEILSKEQFYKLCHISKTTALHLLKNGIVPCINTGMKTRCYQIKKADVQEYLSKRAIFPEAYSAPNGWYCANNTKTICNVPPKIIEDMTAFYTKKLHRFPDVLSVKQVSKITGYQSSTIARWCRLTYLKSYSLERIYIPKPFLIEFLNSIHFRAINQKSKTHISLLYEFIEWRKIQS
jgi:hypothetical protein